MPFRQEHLVQAYLVGQVTKRGTFFGVFSEQSPTTMSLGFQWVLYEASALNYEDAALKVQQMADKDIRMKRSSVPGRVSWIPVWQQERGA